LHGVVADGVPDAAGGHELDPVRAVLDVAADSDGNLVRGVGDIGRARESLIGSEDIRVAVSAGERDEVAG
jgi:hypothetical protein